MVNLGFSNIIICLVAIDVVLSNIPTGVTEVDNHLNVRTKNGSISIFNVKKIKTRRKGARKHRSTSSSSGEREKKSDGSGSKETLSLSYDSSSSSSSTSREKKRNKKYEPKSTVERHGWWKWHRKCMRCPEEMALKWRDPRIKWICGAYQRARRSFKSLCMMHYRNCQDGTMFIKIADHRCDNDTDKMTLPHGDHFFYDYKAELSQDSESSASSASSSSRESSSSSF
ncbi:hypothetical protein evm_011871 [Chilo suppressalis]|nr:hypothetical protein evm_011871 [Chilo suppressalis]